MGALKPQNNSNTVIGTLAVDGWAVTFDIARRGLGGLWPTDSLLAVPNVTAHRSTASVPTKYYPMWHENCLCSLHPKPKGLNTKVKVGIFWGNSDSVMQQDCIVAYLSTKTIHTC